MQQNRRFREEGNKNWATTKCPAAASPPPELFFFEALSPEALRASAMIGTMQKSAPNHRLIFSIVGLRKVSECG